MSAYAESNSAATNYSVYTSCVQPTGRICVHVYVYSFLCVWVRVFFVGVVIFVFFLWFCQYCYVICVSVFVSVKKCTACYLACTACRWRTSKSNVNTKRSPSLCRESAMHTDEQRDETEFSLSTEATCVDFWRDSGWSIQKQTIGDRTAKPSFDWIFQCDLEAPWRVYIMCWHHSFFFF